MVYWKNCDNVKPKTMATLNEKLEFALGRKFRHLIMNVLYDDAHRPLAVIEAKRTCVDVSKGRQQAELYADILEKKHGRRPAIFLTNGFETHILDGQYPERKCATIYSKRDLEKMFNLRTMRVSLKNVMVKKHIAGRYYQEGAIKAVCDAFGNKNRRKALLVMATGSGKTRTVIALCDVLLQHGWVKNILFLADRNSLVTQAKRSFVNLLPDLSCTNLCEENGNNRFGCGICFLFRGHYGCRRFCGYRSGWEARSNRASTSSPGFFPQRETTTAATRPAAKPGTIS